MLIMQKQKETQLLLVQYVERYLKMESTSTWSYNQHILKLTADSFIYFCFGDQKTLYAIGYVYYHKIKFLSTFRQFPVNKISTLKNSLKNNNQDHILFDVITI